MFERDVLFVHFLYSVSLFHVDTLSNNPQTALHLKKGRVVELSHPRSLLGLVQRRILLEASEVLLKY